MSVLSHSACSKFQMCGQSYYYHYIERLRPTTTSAALMFGSVLDEALNVLLTKSNDNADAAFIKAFTNQTMNGEMVHLPNCPNLVYAEADFDVELIKEDVSKDLERYNIIKGEKKKQGFLNLPVEDRAFFNELNWLSLKAKGLLMIDAYKRKVLPLIEEVLAVQKKVSLDNNDGDSIVGYVDLVARIKGHGVVILDNKTSASEYEEDSVLTSPQLALYTHILEEEYKTRKAGYIVMRKNIIKNRKKTCSVCGHDGSGKSHKTCNNEAAGKRCGAKWNETIDPDVNIQFIVDEIPHKTEEIVMQNYDEINKAIKAGHFSRNFNTCRNVYGGPCPYINKCYRDNEKGLTHV